MSTSGSSVQTLTLTIARQNAAMVEQSERTQQAQEAERQATRELLSGLSRQITQLNESLIQQRAQSEQTQSLLQGRVTALEATVAAQNATIAALKQQHETHTHGFKAPAGVSHTVTYPAGHYLPNGSVSQRPVVHPFTPHSPVVPHPRPFSPPSGLPIDTTINTVPAQTTPPQQPL